MKVIMIGDEDLYETLTSEDEAFKRLFKVKAISIPPFPARARRTLRSMLVSSAIFVEKNSSVLLIIMPSPLS